MGADAALLSSSKLNPIKIDACQEHTTFIFSAFYAHQTLKDIKKLPDPTDPRAFEAWFTLYKEWLGVYIRKYFDGLSPIADLEKRLELNDFLKASLKAAEVQDVEPAIKKSADDFKRIQDMRSSIRERNSKFDESYLKSSTEVLRLSASNSSMGKSAPMVSELNTQSSTEKQINVSVVLVKELEERLRIEAKAIFDSLARRVPQEKAREVEQKVQEIEQKSPTASHRQDK